jgi:hypothetical protein
MHRTNAWEQTTTGVEANAPALEHLLETNVKLQNKTVQVRDLSHEMATIEARRTELSKLLQRLLREGDTLMDFLRTGARQHFGYSSGKLIEFGVQPLRRRSRQPEPEPPAPPSPEAPTPEASTSTADTTE